MWTGPIFDADIAGRMTIERAIELCAGKEDDYPSDWSELDIEHSQREIERSVRHISESLLNYFQATIYLLRLMIWESPLVLDKSSMKKLKTGLEERGFRMARCQMPEPMFATDADWNTVLEVTRLAE